MESNPAIEANTPKASGIVARLPLVPDIAQSLAPRVFQAANQVTNRGATNDAQESVDDVSHRAPRSLRELQSHLQCKSE